MSRAGSSCEPGVHAPSLPKYEQSAITTPLDCGCSSADVACSCGASRVGAAVAVDDSGWSSVSWAGIVLALVVSLLLQVGVNYANDYSDGVRGTDDVRVGPLRLVASGSATPQQVRAAALTSLLLASVAGCALAAMTSWWLIAVGVAAVLAAWGYTGGPKPYGYLGLGEVFVFVFFGLVATVGTTFAAVEQLLWRSWVAGAGVGALACALLVVNNLRDLPTDRDVNKRTLAVRLGDARTRSCSPRLLLRRWRVRLQSLTSGLLSPWSLRCRRYRW